MSPNFELYSHNGLSESRALLYDLELLRAVFFERFKFVERARRDVTVYFFRSRKDFHGYSPDAGRKRTSMAGFYHADPDRAVISVAPVDSTDEARHVIFHEYIHHLFRSVEADPPAWFNEGMAELYAGLRVENGQLQIGHPNLGRLVAMRREKLLSLETVFGVGYRSSIYRSADHTGLFYAQSWALVHYWLCGKSDIPGEAVDAFLRVAGDVKAAERTSLDAHFRACFGMDYAEMLKRLERYVRSGHYQYTTQPLPDVPPADTYAVVPVSRNEIRLRLAELAVRVHQSSAGRLVLRQASVDTPMEPRLHEVLGADAWRSGDPDFALEHWNRAIEVGTTNVAVFREVALMECRGWFREFDFDFSLPSDVVDRLRDRLLQSIKREPDQSLAFESLAWVEAFAEKVSIRNVNLVQQEFDRLQDKARTLVALAMVRVRKNKPEEALRLLKSVKHVGPDEWTLQAVEDMTARLENRPAQQLFASDRVTESEQSSPISSRVQSEIRLISVPLPADL